MKPWIAVLAAIVVPGSGHVLLGRSIRGLVFLFWMIIMGYITFHLTTATTSPVGRLSGGIAVWIVSVLEVWKLGRKAARGSAKRDV